MHLQQTKYKFSITLQCPLEMSRFAHVYIAILVKIVATAPKFWLKFGLKIVTEKETKQKNHYHEVMYVPQLNKEISVFETSLAFTNSM